MSGHFSKMTSTAWSDLGVKRLIKCWSNSLRCALAFLPLAVGKIKMGCGPWAAFSSPVEGRWTRQDYPGEHSYAISDFWERSPRRSLVPVNYLSTWVQIPLLGQASVLMLTKKALHQSTGAACMSVGPRGRGRLASGTLLLFSCFTSAHHQRV